MIIGKDEIGMCVGCLPTSTDIEIGGIQKWWIEQMIGGIIIEVNTYGNEPQRNQGLENKDRFVRDNRRFDSNNEGISPEIEVLVKIFIERNEDMVVV
ncbi:hypothetical protein TNCV_2285661 [Trichonephila clavipes]|nr:hypothetical protein TNCV_2285661 [Trichonephila clavipes]